MNRKTRLLLILSMLLLAAFGGAYSYAWIYGATLIRAQIAALYGDAAKVGVRIEGDAPVISGFPGPHIVHFSGKLVEGPQILTLPDVRIRGLFLPGHSVHISLPRGAALEGTVDPAVFSIDDLDIEAAIPLLIPSSLNAEDLAAWQAAGGVIKVDRLHARKETLALDGSGDIALDAQLQPAGSASVHLTGYIDFLEWLKNNGMVKDKQAAFAGMILTGLSKTDPETGAAYLKTELNLKKRTLYVGPLGVITLPVLSWPSKTASRIPPAPPR